MIIDNYFERLLISSQSSSNFSSISFDQPRNKKSSEICRCRIKIINIRRTKLRMLINCIFRKISFCLQCVTTLFAKNAYPIPKCHELLVFFFFFFHFIIFVSTRKFHPMHYDDFDVRRKFFNYS